MTAGRAAGTNGGAGGTSGGRRDALFVLVVVACGVALGVVDAYSITYDRSRLGQPLALWEPLVWEFTSVLVLVALTPAVQAVTRFATPLRAPWSQVASIHLSAAVAFSLVHVVAMGLLRWLVYLAVGEDYPPFGPLGEFAYEFRKDLLVYAAMTALYTIWLRLASAPQSSAAPPAELAATIEVRDGARRIFVALADVAFVEAAGNYVELHRAGGPVLHRASLADMERELSAAGFVRIHRSRLVRRDAIAGVQSKASGDFVVSLVDGRELSGSRRYRRPLLDP